MALDPLELGTIAAILLVFFLWGPQKIPELARMIGQARREFDNATKEFQKVSASIQDGTSPLLATSSQEPSSSSPAQRSPAPVRSALPQTGPNAPTPKTGDQLLIEAARRLGISTQGKTREQIQQDIIAKAQRPSTAQEPSPPPSTDETKP